MSSNHFNTEIFKFSKKIFLIIFNETLWILATCYLNTFHISSFYLLFIFFEIFLVLWYISMKMINFITFSVIFYVFLIILMSMFYVFTWYSLYIAYPIISAWYLSLYFVYIIIILKINCIYTLTQLTNSFINIFTIIMFYNILFTS